MARDRESASVSGSSFDRLDGSARAESLRGAASVCAALVMLMSVVVLYGWTRSVTELRSLLPDVVVMLPNTAVSFLCAGISLLLIVHARDYPRLRLPAQLFAGLVFVIGVVMFAQRMSGADLALNHWLFDASVRKLPFRPAGLMAVNSAASFGLLGMALLSLASGHRGQRSSDALASLALLISASALVGYLYGVQALYTLDQYAGMALSTAFGFVVLASGIILAGADRGLARLLSGVDAGAILARRLLPAALFVPIVLGWLWLVARRNEWIGLEAGVSCCAAPTRRVSVRGATRCSRMPAPKRRSDGPRRRSAPPKRRTRPSRRSSP